MSNKNDLPLVLYRFDQAAARDGFIDYFQNDFELLICGSDIEAQTALEKYGQEIIAVVVEQDILDSSLLERSKTLSPQSKCIFLHKNIALDKVVSLLEQGAIDRCFAKPYDAHIIRSEIYATHMGVSPRFQSGSQSDTLNKRFYALIVDDETRATHYLKKQLEKLNCPCEIILAANASEALELFHKHKDSLALVISDQRMPGMLGNQLLAEIFTHNPNIIRILTSAYDEVDVALNAVNEGQIFRYIKKPWDAEKICSSIEISLTKFLSTRKERDKQQSLSDEQFRQIISARKMALNEYLTAEVDAFAGKGSLQYFFDILMKVETLAPTVSSLRASEESSLEQELISVFSQSVLTKLNKVNQQTEFTRTSIQKLQTALSELVQGRQVALKTFNESPIASQILTSLQQLLESSGLGYEALEIEQKEENLIVQTKVGKSLSIFKHIFSALNHLPPQMIEQQSSMLMLMLVVRKINGSIAIESAQQKFTLKISLPLFNINSLNAHFVD